MDSSNVLPGLLLNKENISDIIQHIFELPDPDLGKRPGQAVTPELLNDKKK